MYWGSGMGGPGDHPAKGLEWWAGSFSTPPPLSFWTSRLSIHIIDLICIFVSGRDCCEFIEQEITYQSLDGVPIAYKFLEPVSTDAHFWSQFQATFAWCVLAHSAPEIDAYSGTKMEARSWRLNSICSCHILSKVFKLEPHKKNIVLT